VLGEDRVHDVGCGLLLEDPAVGGAGEEPQPGPQRGPVARLVALVAREGAAADQAVEPALAAHHVELDRHGGAEQAGEVDRGVVAGELQLEAKRPAQRLLAAQAAEAQPVAQRAREPDRTLVEHVPHLAGLEPCSRRQ